MTGLVFVVICLAVTVSAYSGGAPVDVCADMTPKHPAPPQKSAMPYEVKVNDKHVAPGGLLKITVSGKSPFKGFLVQVRHGEQPVGKFLVPDTDKYMKTINCGSGNQNAATHKNSELKNEIHLDWQAPASLKDQVQIFITVAQDGATYWVRQPTVTIKVN